jgi:DNA-binding transcriptional ArsR family regulator
MNGEDAAAVERRPPEAAFGLLASDLRVAILRALGEGGDGQTFSELRERVGEQDSGKFNYHLGKLVGSFVTRGDDGYALSLAGRQVYGAIRSGAYTADATIEPFALAGPCPMCGAPELTAEYDKEVARLSCPDCDVWRNEFSFPPGTLDQFEPEELPHAFDRWMRATVQKVLQGFCSNCGGRVAGRLERTPDAPMPAVAVFACDRCGDELRSSPAIPVFFTPTAVSFFADHGVDVFTDPSWRYVTPDDELDVSVAEDSLTAAVTVTRDGDKLTATVDEDVTVTDAAVA